MIYRGWTIVTSSSVASQPRLHATKDGCEIAAGTWSQLFRMIDIAENTKQK